MTLDTLFHSRVYDLAQPYFVGMPHFPTHPPFVFGLTKKHGDFVMKNGGSSAADAIAMCSHNGTHIDALNHLLQRQTARRAPGGAGAIVCRRSHRPFSRHDVRFFAAECCST